MCESPDSPGNTWLSLCSYMFYFLYVNQGSVICPREDTTETSIRYAHDFSMFSFVHKLRVTHMIYSTTPFTAGPIAFGKTGTFHVLIQCSWNNHEGYVKITKIDQESENYFHIHSDAQFMHHFYNSFVIVKISVDDDLYILWATSYVMVIFSRKYNAYVRIDMASFHLNIHGLK